MSRQAFTVTYDRLAVRDILSTTPEERPPVKLPKPTRPESGAPWAIRPVASVSPAERRAKFARGYIASRPGEWKDD